MKRLVRFIPAVLFVLLCILHNQPAHSQYFSNYDPNEELFTRQVKLIDEFIERFNNDDSTLLKKAYRKANKDAKITRGLMLVSLFNLEDASFTDKDTTLKAFFRQVLDPNHPVFLSFADPDWYAEAQAVFIEGGKTVEIPLILHVMSNGNEWSKWMITGIGDLKQSNVPKPSITVKTATTAPEYISTSAHATNFVELHYAFSANMVPANFFEPGLLATPKCTSFLSRIRSGQLRFAYVKQMTFHFYHVDGWVFTVDEFRRKNFNSGWLISSIQKMSKQEKEARRRRLLGW